MAHHSRHTPRLRGPHIESPSAGEWTLALHDFSSVRGREPYRIEVDFLGPETFGKGEILPQRAAITAALAAAPGQETEVRFAIPRAGRATLDVFDVQGRRVRRLSEGMREAGDHAVTWDEHDGDGQAVGRACTSCAWAPTTASPRGRSC
jgi:hypothetical protein